MNALIYGIVFGLLGFLANWFRIEMFFGVDFLFGSFFVMLAILRYGAVAGIASGIIASSCTYLLWGHPWAIVVFSAEAIFVSWKSRNRPYSLVFSDIAFWVCCGIPMVWLFYHHVMGLQGQTSLLILLKQPINGILNALLALLANLGLQFRHGDRKTLPTFQQLIFVTLIAMTLLPTLILFTFSLKEYQQTELQQLEMDTVRTTQLARQSITHRIHEALQDVVTLASMTGDPDRTPVPVMQRHIETVKAMSPNLKRIGVLNSRAITVAYWPKRDENGRSNLGLDFSDRPFISRLKQEHSPLRGDMIMGRIGTPSPILPLLAPIMVAGEYRGYCAGMLDLNLIRKRLSDIIVGWHAQVTLLDRNGRVVTSTRPDLKPMDLFTPLPGKAVAKGSRGVFHLIPYSAPGGSNMQRWRSSLFVQQEELDGDSGWSIRVESSLKPLLDNLSRKAIRVLLLLALIIIASVCVSHLVSSRLTGSLQQLKTATLSLPRGLLPGKWPESRIEEVHGLIDNFRQAAVALNNNFSEMKSLILALENQVEERKQAESALLLQQKKLETMAFELSQSEERERCRIAGELHDQVGQRLILGKIRLNGLASKLDDHELDKDLAVIETLIDHSIQDIRSLTFHLRPPILASAGLEAALRWLGEEFRENFGLEVTVTDDMAQKPLEYECRSTVFQVVRELLMNVAKHADTSAATVSVRRVSDALVIQICDQGVGFDPGLIALRKEGGFGLYNIRQRIEFLGGSLALESGPGRGTSATIEVPLNRMTKNSSV